MEMHPQEIDLQMHPQEMELLTCELGPQSGLPLTLKSSTSSYWLAQVASM
ncbi:hypothetical protein HYC85_020782 [Camellia sinensis]|uniref:Uncharacterized protein n=1 Tax=Camellia sinensis TaxID=4442 RepID=A0A7J7GR30_CAMSI|nr:hypothetical protein HYC85_020782 [Camellia sinensis]